MLTDLSFLDTGAAWPPSDEKKRLQRYEENRMLFDGKHDKVYHNWIRLSDDQIMGLGLSNDQKATFELVLNWHKRLSVLWASLLFSEPPRISAGDTGTREQDAIERISEKNRFVTVSREVAIDVSRFGVGIYKVRYDGRRSVIEAQPPANWFPVVQFDNIKNIQYHVLAVTYQEKESRFFGLTTKEANRLKVEIHEIGKITTRVYDLVGGSKIGTLISENEIVTGADEFLVFPVHNLSTSDRTDGIDDYEDIDGIVQELENRVAQISRILDKHADPSMYGPDSALQYNPDSNKYEVKVSGGKYYSVKPGEKEPGYITWDGQLEAAFKQIDGLMEQLYFLSETSPAAFGQLKSGLAESGSALRRLMMAPLTKTSRVRTDFDPIIKSVFRTAAGLEVAQSMPNAIKIDKVTIEWQDGLPRDETEEVQNETMMLSAGATSLESVLRRVYGLDGDALKEEMDRIAKEKAPPMSPNVKLPDRGTDPNGGHQH